MCNYNQPNISFPFLGGHPTEDLSPLCVSLAEFLSHPDLELLIHKILFLT